MTQRLAALTPATRSLPSGHQGLVDTRILSKPDQVASDGMNYSDWTFKLQSYMGAVEARYQPLMMDAEISTMPVPNATLGQDETQLSTHFFYGVVMLTSGPALDKCHNVGLYEIF